MTAKRNPKGAGRKRVLPEGSKRFCVTIIGPAIDAYVAAGGHRKKLAKDVARVFHEKYLQLPNR